MPFGGPMAISGTSCCAPAHTFKVYGSACTDPYFPDSNLKVPCTIRVTGPTGSGYDETAHTDSTTKLASLPMPTVSGTYHFYADVDAPRDVAYDQGTRTLSLGTYPWVFTGDILAGVSLPAKSAYVCVVDTSPTPSYGDACPRTLYLTCRFGSATLTYGTGVNPYPWGTTDFAPSASGSCGGGTGYVIWEAAFAYYSGSWHIDFRYTLTSGEVFTFTGGGTPTCDMNLVLGPNTFTKQSFNTTAPLSALPMEAISVSPSVEVTVGDFCNSSCIGSGTLTVTSDVDDTITVTN